ncbi:MAG: LrgB family protein [Spirochaetales bacterium]|nr:LrgB family protein [Spirochaetales bacterium]
MADLIQTFSETPMFGLVLTLTAYAVGQKIYIKLPVSFFHPVLTASALIILFLFFFDISLDDYQNGGRMISFMLGPATVSLALPLYKKIDILKSHFLIILTAITVGTITSIISVTLISKTLNLPSELTLSLIPKSVTTPIAVETAEKIGGLPSITALSVIFTGITGAVTGPALLKLFRIKSPTAKGLALGTASHAIGTSRALELGQTEGAISSLSIGLAGIITAIAAPILVRILF